MHLGLSKTVWGLRLILVLALSVTALPWQPSSVSAAPQPETAGRTFYVSRRGNNADGLSWGTAWNELANINWSAVQPGDTILLDGGSVSCPKLGPGYSCGMVYNSTLSITRSGTSSAPITIRLAGDAGRNGTVIIDGGVTNWPGCADYAPEQRPPSTPGTAGMRASGVNFNNSAWVVVDGIKWGGIEVRNHLRSGLTFAASQHTTARYIKIHHNTDPADATNGSIGVNLTYQAAYNTLARSEVFRNGQDAVRNGGDFFTLEDSYLHDQYCNHPDGIQSFVPTGLPDIPDDAGEVRGLVVRRTVFDHIGMQALLLGENDGGHNSWNVDVTIEDNLFVNGDYMVKAKHALSSNWTVRRNTFANVADLAVEWCCATPGASVPMAISDNVFWQVNPGRNGFYLPTGGGDTLFANNCVYGTGVRSGNVFETGTINANPLFVDPARGNYALRSGSPCAGKGARVTSVSTLAGCSASDMALDAEPAAIGAGEAVLTVETAPALDAATAIRIWLPSISLSRYISATSC